MKDRLRRHWLVAFSLILCSALLVSAYAVSTLWSASTTVTISTSSPYIKVYDSWECTREVTSIDLGNLVPGSMVRTNLYIKNTHPNFTFLGIDWGSTLNTVTSTITDDWVPATWWPMDISPGEVKGSTYYVTVESDCPLGTYSWTLYLIPPA